MLIISNLYVLFFWLAIDSGEHVNTMEKRTNLSKIEIVKDHVAIILDYYQDEERIFHKTIDLYGEEMNMIPLIELLIEEYPAISFRVETDKTECAGDEAKQISDLAIVVPDEIFSTREGTFVYQFQSRLKNIFGTYEVSVKMENGVWTSDVGQLIVTLIGD